MQSNNSKTQAASQLAAAFDHSITWEDDIWCADPVDVEEVHKKARKKFYDLLDAVTSQKGAKSQARILLFHGQSGAGKTHLIRALRTGAHRRGRAYFGYAQMTPDVSRYADYYLRRLIASLEKPYDPDEAGETALARLTRRLVEDAEVMPAGELEKLREAALDEKQLARLIHSLADDIVASPRCESQELDINIVRALLYLQRNDPRIDQRVRQYLYGRPLNELSLAAVAALDPNTGDGRAFEIIESLGKLMWTVDRAAFVNRILPALFGPHPMFVTAKPIRCAGVVFLDPREHLVIERGGKAGQRGSDGLGIGVLGLQIGADLGVVFLTQPEVRVFEHLPVQHRRLQNLPGDRRLHLVHMGKASSSRAEEPSRNPAPS